MSGPALDVVVVTYRSRERIAACLRSLERAAPRGPMRVVVVDNDSPDGTADVVRREFPHVDLVENAANVGFARATNAGIRRGSAPYVLALNPDTEVFEGALDTLLDLMEVQPDIGIAGPSLLREDGTPDHAARRGFPTIAGALGHFLVIGRLLRRGRLAQYRAPEVERGAVDAVNGAFMLLRRRALDEVGLFDEGYWMYMEDLDLCYRFAEAGWTTWYEPDAVAMHVKGASAGAARPARLNYAFHYGMARFYRAHYAPKRPRLVNAAVYTGIWAKLAVSVVRSLLRRSAAVVRRQPGGRSRGGLSLWS